MGKLLEILKSIFTPSAFKLGIIVTFTLTYVSFRYYTLPIETIDNSTFYSLIHLMDQKSTDFRMKLRGEIPPSDHVIILAIDEKSIEKFGRWPWSRKVMAEVVHKLGEYNIKGVGFDIVFSEEEKVVPDEIAEAIKTLPKTQSQNLSKKLENLNGDQLLAAAIEKYSGKVVLGVYTDKDGVLYEPYQEECVRTIDKNLPEYADVTGLLFIAGITDSDYKALPAPIAEYINTAIQKIISDIETSNGLSFAKQRDAILPVLKKFCFNFLRTDESIKWIEKNWILFQSADESLANISATDWIQSYKNSALYSEMEHAERVWTNIPTLNEKATHHAHFNAFPDRDGMLRRSKLFLNFDGQPIPSLATALAHLHKGQPLQLLLQHNPQHPTHRGIAELQWKDTNDSNKVASTTPLSADGYFTINYAGPQKMFPHLSVAELLNGKDSAIIQKRVAGVEGEYTVNKTQFLKDKLVLVGATAVGIYDMRSTPFQENYPGVETHANILENLIFESYLITDDQERIFVPLFILLFGLFMSYAVARSGALWGVLISAGSILGGYFFDKYYFFENRVVLSLFLPLMLAVSIYVILTFYKYLTEERKKKELKGTFQKYVSPAIVNEILSHPEKINLGGRKENMTVMFSDVRGFTTLAEKLDPEVLSSFLNRYLTPMTRLVFKNDGTLDKYIGDAVMAFFGAPITDKDHAKKCCQTALEMIEKLHELNKEFEKDKFPPIDIGIGINTGDMSVGNMGSDIVRSYTVMGDSVNLASRLEGINKSYGTRIIISQFTHEKIHGQFSTRELDWVRVKGKLLPVKIYELLGGKKIDPTLQEAVELFKNGFDLYHEQKFDLALEKFSACLNKIPNDSPAQLYIERCQEYQKNPPPQNWDGVYEFKTK